MPALREDTKIISLAADYYKEKNRSSSIEVKTISDVLGETFVDLFSEIKNYFSPSETKEPTTPKPENNIMSEIDTELQNYFSVSNNPDRQFYSSTVEIEDKFFKEDTKLRPTVRPKDMKTVVLSAQKLDNDTEFQAAFTELNKKYGVKKENLYALIDKESSFRPQVANKINAVGLFQFLPSVLNDKNDQGKYRLGRLYEPIEVRNMSPAEQLRLYTKYLDSWNFEKGQSLGMMQAAPSLRTRKGSEVIYKKGSDEYKQNPGWVDKSTKLITVDSINAYYGTNK